MRERDVDFWGEKTGEQGYDGEQYSAADYLLYDG
jgi:hypothetical protein